MKKVCFFSGDITRGGGTERVSVMLANELVKQKKYEICFLSLCEQQEEPFFPLSPEIPRYHLGNRWLSPGPGYLPLVPRLRRFLKSNHIDLIIDIDIVLDVLSIPAVVGLGTRVLSWEHSNCFFEQSIWYRKAILKFSVKHSDYVVTLTEGDKANYKRMLKRTERIEAIYNPMEEIEVFPHQPKEKMILTVGHLVEGKGISYLLEIAPRVLKEYPDWTWYLLGDGPEKDAVERVVQTQALEGRLVAAGRVGNVGDYLRRAELMVMTSKSEGLPMCLLEAKAYGIPCVSFDIPTGPAEIIRDGENGYLIPPFDCRQMSEKIMALMGREELRRNFAAATGLDRDKFRMQQILEKWNRVLDELCE